MKEEESKKKEEIVLIKLNKKELKMRRGKKNYAKKEWN
jgi:hypothetical protein